MRLPAGWYLYGDRSSRADATLGDAGGWPSTLVGLRTRAATSLDPRNLPPGWYENNMAGEDHPDTWQPLPPQFLNYGAQYAQRYRALAPIGPTDQTQAQAAALQAALASALRGANGAG